MKKVVNPLMRGLIRARARLEGRERPADLDYSGLAVRYAAGRSFADIGCMWRLDGRLAFLAEAAGATEVTAFDAMEASPAYLDEHTRRKSSVRFVRGDLHDPATPAEVGLHDVVWCSGLLYHAPSPMLSLERLAQMTRDILIIGTKTIPEIPGFPSAAIYFPGLTPEQRLRYEPLWPGAITAPFDEDPVRSYANWWWGLTRSALTNMMSLGFEITETTSFVRSAMTDDFFIVGQRRESIEEHEARIAQSLADAGASEKP